MGTTIVTNAKWNKISSRFFKNIKEKKFICLQLTSENEMGNEMDNEMDNENENKNKNKFRIQIKIRFYIRQKKQMKMIYRDRMLSEESERNYLVNIKWFFS